MKVLLDHNLDRRLKQLLRDVEVSTTHDQGWATLTNGELLSAAEKQGFDVLLTADSNIKHQQNLMRRSISIVVIRASNNRLSTHAKMLPEISEALNDVGPASSLRYPIRIVDFVA